MKKFRITLVEEKPKTEKVVSILEELYAKDEHEIRASFLLAKANNWDSVRGMQLLEVKELEGI